MNRRKRSHGRGKHLSQVSGEQDIKDAFHENYTLKIFFSNLFMTQYFKFPLSQLE